MLPVAVQMTANDRMTKGLSGPYLARFFLNRLWLLIPFGLLPYLRPHLPTYALGRVLYHLL